MVSTDGIPIADHSKPLRAIDVTRGRGFRPIQGRAQRSHAEVDTNRQPTQFDEEIKIVNGWL